MLQAVCETNDPHGIIVRTLSLAGSKESLFGTRGERNSKGQFPDGLHLRGPRGRAVFTKVAIEMLKNVSFDFVDYQSSSKIYLHENNFQFFKI